jgi:hypothetical protein
MLAPLNVARMGTFDLVGHIDAGRKPRDGSGVELDPKLGQQSTVATARGESSAAASASKSANACVPTHQSLSFTRFAMPASITFLTSFAACPRATSRRDTRFGRHADKKCLTGLKNSCI